MGCDIHVTLQRRSASGWEDVDVSPPIWDGRSYSVFALLAGVRNYSGITPLSEPRGLPEGDRSYENAADDYFYHSASWFSMDELSAIDPEEIVEDRRYTKQVGPNHWDGGATSAVGAGQEMPLREFLGEAFFHDIQRAKSAGVERIVFAFDN